MRGRASACHKLRAFEPDTKLIDQLPQIESLLVKRSPTEAGPPNGVHAGRLGVVANRGADDAGRAGSARAAGANQLHEHRLAEVGVEHALFPVRPPHHYRPPQH